MSIASPPAPLSFVEPTIARAVLASVENAVAMCGLPFRCVGMASIPSGETGLITGLIGVHGKVTGFVTVNVSERVGIKAVEGLLGERFEKLCSQVIDGAGELTNIITGGIKSQLAGSSFAFSHITVPSVIVGKGYQIAFAKGLEFLCATFEHLDEEAYLLDDRLLRVSISLLRL